MCRSAEENEDLIISQSKDSIIYYSVDESEDLIMNQ